MIEMMLTDDRHSFQPGDTISGSLRWELEKAAEFITVELYWTTKGKGTKDTFVAESSQIATMGQLQGESRFRLTAPAAPYSFSGRLISLIWHVEIAGKDELDSAGEEITIAPGGKEIRL